MRLLRRRQDGKMIVECFFVTKTLMRETITENTRVQIPVGTKVRRGHLVYVASGITSSRITQPCGLTSLPTGNRAPSGAVIFSRVECFNLSRHIRRRTDQPFTTGHASSTTKRGALKWLTQEADAKNWSSPKHVQPEEGRKEPAPRAIRFRKSRVETTI